MRHQDMQMAKGVDYALRLRVGAVIRRLGSLLDLYAIAPKAQLKRLHDALTKTYVGLDPTLPMEGSHLAR
jgi:predicted transcriptional regulator of viral defense system